MCVDPETDKRHIEIRRAALSEHYLIGCFNIIAFASFLDVEAICRQNTNTISVSISCTSYTTHITSLRPTRCYGIPILFHFRISTLFTLIEPERLDIDGLEAEVLCAYKFFICKLL